MLPRKIKHSNNIITKSIQVVYAINYNHNNVVANGSEFNLRIEEKVIP
jgi:hypothetical protein